MKTKVVKGLLALIGAATLLAGCASNQGGEGNETQYGGGAGGNTPTANGNGGANGTISRTNPFGFGTGSGITPAY